MLEVVVFGEHAEEVSDSWGEGVDSPCADQVLVSIQGLKDRGGWGRLAGVVVHSMRLFCFFFKESTSGGPSGDFLRGSKERTVHPASRGELVSGFFVCAGAVEESFAGTKGISWA